MLIEALDTGDGTGDEESNRLEEDIKGMYNELCEIRKRLAKLKMEEKKRAKAEEKELKEARVYGETKAETIKIKRLQAPNFSGNIRDYPSSPVAKRRLLRSPGNSGCPKFYCLKVIYKDPRCKINLMHPGKC